MKPKAPTQPMILAAEKVFMLMALNDIMKPIYESIENDVIDAGAYHYAPENYEYEDWTRLEHRAKLIELSLKLCAPFINEKHPNFEAAKRKAFGAHFSTLVHA